MTHTFTRKQEKGSLMVEILAVLGLIAMITPLLYQQINRRNEEISNANIATEIRTIKDGVSAYIQSYEQRLSAQDCNLMANGEYKNVSTIQQCTSAEGTYGAELQGTGFYPGIDEVLDDYDINLFAYTLPAGYQKFDANEAARVQVYRPVIYGVITEKAVDEGRPLRRSAKVASLIGLDGGVVSGNVINGMDGTWVVENTMNAPERAIAAITAYDAATNSALLTDVKIEHFRGDTLQANVGVADKLHVPTFFSVGDMTYNCVENYGNDTLNVRKSGDSINGTDGSNVVCAPLFEVDATTGKIKMKDGKIETDLIAFSATANADDNTKAALVPDGNIDLDELTENDTYTVYQVDPAYTSVMNDIKLTSRGGARLSDVLPNYVLKDIKYISSATAVADWPTIDIPTCPVGYAPAISIVPSMVQTNKVLSVDTQKIADAIRGPDNTVADTPSISKITIDGAVRLVIKTALSNFNEGEGMRTETSGTTGTWTIMPQYWVRTGETTGSWENVTNSAVSGTTFSALVQTYCVYDETKFTAPDKVR